MVDAWTVERRISPEPRLVLRAMSENVPTPPRTDCIARTLALIDRYSTPDALVRARLGLAEAEVTADQPMTRERATAPDRTPTRPGERSSGLTE